ncbi:MarR family winged helix-turn-helix transcriptional regulator [Kitasatospora sp. NPDC056531]|uniref:MarR family winged helix-turn-helix transcriptional regulator n=1 Tax=Kitasatospora sp. NPDC056531 TaxID=3345856 RepID=UPI00369AE0DA
MDTPPPMPDDLATFWYLTRRVAGLMDRNGEALFQRELGISLAQFLVLSVIDAHPGPLSQQQVADRLGLTKGTVSRQIDNAVSAGLVTVQPSPRSRRENAVFLTPAGTDLVRRGDTAFHQDRAAIQSLVDPDDMRAAIRVLAATDKALGTHRDAHH